MVLLAIGAVITGIALGLTGGGGTLLALPFLQHVMGLPLAEATAASLAAVGVLSGVGALWRIRDGALKPRLGFMFAGAGWLGAPLGAWLHGQLPEAVIAVLFAVVVVIVAIRMWLNRADPPLATVKHDAGTGPVCRFSVDGHLRLTTRCGKRLVALGFGVGVLSGIVGVGGGFLAVPALMALTGLPLRAAVATSLMVVSLIAIAGWGSHVLLGHRAPLDVLGVFIAGGVVGLGLGSWLVQRIPQTVMRRGFAVLLLGVAVANVWPVLRQYLIV